MPKIHRKYTNTHTSAHYSQFGPCFWCSKAIYHFWYTFLAWKNALIKNFIIYIQVKYLLENIWKAFSIIQYTYSKQTLTFNSFYLLLHLEGYNFGMHLTF